MTISDQLRQYLAEVPSVNAVAKATGVPQPHLAAFKAGKRGLSLPSIDAVCEHLGVRLTKPRKAKGTGR